MNLLPIAAVALALTLLDAGIHHWRNIAPASSAPVWSLEVKEEDRGNTEGSDGDPAKMQRTLRGPFSLRSETCMA